MMTSITRATEDDDDNNNNNNGETTQPLRKLGRYGVLYYPNANQVKQLMSRSPFSLYYDRNGRIYGRIDENNNELARKIAESDPTFIGGGRTLLLWIFVPPQALDNREFPRPDDEVELFRYQTKILEMKIIVLRYPEAFTSAQTSTTRSLIVSRK